MKRLTLAVAVVCTLMTGSGAAQAGFNTCNGSPIIWRGPLAVTRNSCSIPDTGIKNSAYWNGVKQWNDLAGEVDSFLVRPPSDCEFEDGDGVNEIGIVQPAVIDGALGTTFVSEGGCFIGPNDIDEADMAISDGFSFMGRLGNIISTNNARDTFVHEFGHFFGLQHVGVHSVMRASGAVPITSGNEASTIWPADAFLLNSAYTYSVTGPDLIISSQGVVGGGGGSVVNLDGSNAVVRACRGTTFTTKVYVGNLGNVGVSTFNLRVVLSTVAPLAGLTAGGTTVVNFTWNNFPAFGENTFTLPFTVPNLATGGYFIYQIVDNNNVITEIREGNNRTLSAKKLLIDC